MPDQRDLANYWTKGDRIQPGDVIAFSGVDVPSTVVKVATHSDYVHVAIVFSVENAPPADHQSTLAESSPSLRSAEFSQGKAPQELTPQGLDAILIAESHIDTSLPSVGTGKHTLGVQLQWLSHRLVCAQGPVWLAPLRTPLTPAQIHLLQTWLWDIEAQGTPYDFVQAVGAGVDVCDRFGFENTPDESAFFCSELVTCALQKVGVVSDRINSSEQTPADIMAFPCFHAPVLIQCLNI